MKVLFLVGTLILSLSSLAVCTSDKEGGCSSKEECSALDKSDSTFVLVYKEDAKSCVKQGCKDQKMNFNAPKLSCEPLDCKTIVDSANRDKPATGGSSGSASGVKAKDQ